MAIQDRFPTISDPFLTISGRFLTISDSFPTISGRFVNRPTSSRPILTVSRPTLEQFSIVRHHLSHRGSTTGDRPATETGASSEPSQTTHGRYNMGPQGQTHRKKETHTQRRPFPLHFTPIFTRLPTISWPFQTKYHHHTRTTQGRYNRGPPGHQNTDNRHTAQSQPSRTTHGLYNMGPQGQKS